MQKEIAYIIDKTPSAISQEIKRNKDHDGIYRANSAKRKKKERRIIANQRSRRIENDIHLEKYIEKGLYKHLSPEQISGRLKYVHGISCCKNTIYTWIYEKRKDLVKYLHCKKGFYRRRYGTRIREKRREKAKIKRIDTRPDIVEKREGIGDWEGDTIISSDKKKRLVTSVERKSGYGIIEKIDNVTSTNMHTILQNKKPPS